MRELRKNADDRQRYETAVGATNTAALTGYPVHFINGKWYVELMSRGVVSPNAAREALNIQQLLEDGDWKWNSAADRIQVWDAGQWLEIPMEIVYRIQDEDILNFLQDGEVIPAAKVKRLKEALVEHEDEAERLALRQLLAESQQEGDDDEAG